MNNRQPVWPLLLAAFVISLSGYSQKKNSGVDSVAYYIEELLFAKGLKLAEPQVQTLLAEKKYKLYTERTVQISEIYYGLGDNGKSLDYLFTALKILQKQAQSRNEITILRQIGNLYSRMQHNDRALRYFRSALRKAREIKHDSLAESFNQSFFKVHFDMESDSIEFFVKKTMLFAKTTESPVNLYKAYNNYFVYYQTLKNTDLEKKYIDSSEHYAKLLKSTDFIRTTLTNKAGYYYDLDDYLSAKKTYDEMFRINKNDTLNIEVGYAYYTYADILFRLGDYKNAYMYADKAANNFDYNYNERLTKKVADIAASYRISNLVKTQNLEREQFARNHSRNRLVQIILVAVFLLTIIVFYFFYQNTALKQKSKLQNVQSKMQQSLLTATLDAQEAERKKIASVLHDNISALLSSAGLQLTAFASGQESKSDEIVKTRNILKEAHDKVRDLSHELVPTLLAKFGLAYAIQDLCEKNSNKNIVFDCEISGSIKRYDEDFEMKIYFIVSELLNNVMKHSQATKATITLNANSELSVAVEDNGKGFETGKSNENEGFGLTQIRARINGLGGKFTVTSKPNQGTTAQFNVPIIFK
ncbi:MAG: tetratricopeptide repeat protein [Flavobacterium sp.]|uniref:tetratricopeptide repeat-containing sensor histidine kinase n=1 Tax=Flavobacterium sp. TaxID=239 RepID=UPI0011FCF3D1|nr:sensor histidine kinase [Flavobacterium sp.]RZJ67585.1 MAG: tetratricopeptide repeat protein [Flavobacterium sp.]